jgi:hypothetical protein
MTSWTNRGGYDIMKKTIDWMNILERAIWTFIEGFLLALPASFSLEMDGAAWKAVIFSAGMAGLSAVKTFIVEMIQKNREIKE